jgi:hypothetical protein
MFWKVDIYILFLYTARASNRPELLVAVVAGNTMQRHSSAIVSRSMELTCSFMFHKLDCGEPAISLHSFTVPLVQLSTCLLPVMRGPGFNPQGGTYEKPGFSCWRCLATCVTPTRLIIVASSEEGFVPNLH